jgi:hypothetical protein
MHLLLVSILAFTTLFVNAPQQTAVWHAYSSDEGRFSTVLPNEPMTTLIATPTEKGALFTHTVSATDSDLNEYMVSWTAYDHNVEAKGTDKTYDRVRDALVLSKNGRLVSESSVVMQGRPGRAVVFTDDEGRTVKVRFYFIGTRFYQVMAENRGKQTDSDTFLESFKVQN